MAARRARNLNSEIIIIARAVRTEDVAALRKMGVTRVVQPEFEGGIEIVRPALDAWDFDCNEVWRLIQVLPAEL